MIGYTVSVTCDESTVPQKLRDYQFFKEEPCWMKLQFLVVN